MSIAQRLGGLILAAGLAVTSPTASAEKVIRYAFLTAETGFDPAQISDLYSRAVAANIFDAPLRNGWLSGEPEPNTLTEMPRVSADFRTWTFHLKPGIYFADDPAFNGKKRELVAADYVYSFKRLYDPKYTGPAYSGVQTYNIESLEKLREEAVKSGHFDYDKTIDGIKVLDRYTYQITLGNPSPRFATDNLFDGSIYGAVAREVVEKYGDSIMEHPVGTGAYVLTDWVRSSHMVFTKNPNYRTELYDAKPAADDAAGQALAKEFNGKRMPFVDRVEISIIEESQPRWLAFLNGQLDIVEQVPPDLAPVAMPNNKLAPNLAKKQLSARRTPLLRESMVIFNMEDPVVGGYTPEKVALRRAIGLGLDIPKMISQVESYEAIPAQSIIYPRMYGYQPELKTEAGEFDLAKARAILDTYGYVANPGERYRHLPDGKPLTIVYNSAPDQLNRNINEILKRSMDNLGVRIEINIAQWPELLKRAQTGSYQMWFLGYSSETLDPGGGFQEFYGPGKGAGNLSRFDLPEYNQLYQKQDATPNGAERLAMLDRMRDLLIAYEPLKPTWHPIGIALSYPWVKGYRYDPLVSDWWRYVDVDEGGQRPYLK
jgi:ABC-type transport system substrate-binding protein